MNKNSKAGKAIPFLSDANENDITSFFECPVCFDYVLPPIYQCRSGHLVCSSCRINLKCCPTCRGPLGNIRNLAMEKVASTILFPCKYNNSGCTKSLSHTEKLEHEEICEYRPYVCPCPGASCKWQGSLEQVMSHLLVSHKTITTLQGEDIVFLATDITLPGNVDWVMMQSCFGHYFILVLEKQERNVVVMPTTAVLNNNNNLGNNNNSLNNNNALHLAASNNNNSALGTAHNLNDNTLANNTSSAVLNANALGLHSSSSGQGGNTQPLQQFYAVVQIIGSRKQAENFAYKLELNGNNRRLTWEARPRSVHEGVANAISKSDCLVFESGVAALFSENGNLAINVTITLTSTTSLNNGGAGSGSTGLGAGSGGTPNQGLPKSSSHFGGNQQFNNNNSNILNTSPSAGGLSGIGTSNKNNCCSNSQLTSPANNGNNTSFFGASGNFFPHHVTTSTAVNTSPDSSPPTTNSSNNHFLLNNSSNSFQIPTPCSNPLIGHFQQHHATSNTNFNTSVNTGLNNINANSAGINSIHHHNIAGFM